MSLRHLTLVSVCIVFICTDVLSGELLNKAVGDEISFGPDKMVPPVNSIIWKHKSNNNEVVKVIEWDEDGIVTPNPKFKDIISLNKMTGYITIKKLRLEHSGEYSIQINSKEQDQKFILTVKEQVPKPEITIERNGNPDAVYLSCELLKKAVGDEISFGPDKMVPPVNSIIWKHKSNNNEVVKVIEWDEDGIVTPNPKFKDITFLNKTTGYITIKKLRLEHSGEYSIEINSKEQDQKFILTVKEQVPKSEITIEKTSSPDVVYLRCDYSETIIWRNSTGETLIASDHNHKGDSLTVRKSGNPDNYLMCTLDNGVSQETSDLVYERDLFSEVKWKFDLWIGIVVISLIFILLFLFIPPFHGAFCAACCGRPKTSRK